MKSITRAAVATAAALAFPCAHAQSSSVNLYGVMDTGLEFANHAGAGGAGSVFRETSGNLAGSRWGMRGSEDLGGGMSAIFVIEGGIFTDTGTSAQGGRLFGRQSFVGLDTRYGSLTLGRQIHTLFRPAFLIDPLKYASYGVLAHDVYLAGRADNAVKYKKAFGPLTVEGMYSFGYDSMIANGGEVPGNYRVGQEMGASVTYQANDLAVVAAYDQRRGSTVATESTIERRYLTGLAWSYSKFTAYLGYRLLQSPLTDPSTRTNLYWIGASYAFAPAFTLSGGVYRSDQRHSVNAAMNYSLTAEYSLSKRSVLYLNASFMDNKGTSRLGVGPGPTLSGPGLNQTGVVTGIKHIF